MLTLNSIYENAEQDIIRRLKIKNFDASKILKEIKSQDSDRRKYQVLINGYQNELNKHSKSIGNLINEGKIEEADKAKNKSGEFKNLIKECNDRLIKAERKLYDLLIQLPNLPNELVPEGNSSEFNKKIRWGGRIPPKKKSIYPHWDLAIKYKLIDFELGNKITGANFPVYLDKGAILQRALINFFLEENRKAGYKEVLPPFIVNEDSARGTGQLPDKEGQMYVTEEKFYLIPTAEVPVTNIYRDTILELSDFPIKLTAYTPCFRREAGSYGKDVRGLNRLHQFDKVEIVQIQHPDNSYAALDEMVTHVEGLLIKLELPYRIMQLCGGDMGFTSALTYDFEVFSAAQKRWLEVSSVSNFESFQANRLKLRFRDPVTKKTMLAHTLNGSALALPRIVAALLENNQTTDGIIIPKVLRSYTGFDRID